MRLQRVDTSSESVPRAFDEGITAFFEDAIWVLWSKSTQSVSSAPGMISLVKEDEGDEEGEFI